MKNLFLIVFTIISSQLFSQFTIFFDESLFSCAKKNNYKWSVNGKTFKVSKFGIKLKTNYPLTDTIYFTSNRDSFNIITRFKPKENYVFMIGCCAEGFEIYPKDDFEEVKNWRYKELTKAELDSIVEQDSMHLEDFEIKVQLKNKFNSDSLFIFYGNHMAPLLYCYPLENNTESPGLLGVHPYLSPQYSTLYLFHPDWNPKDVFYDKNVARPDALPDEVLYEENILVIHREKWKFIFNYNTKKAEIQIE